MMAKYVWLSDGSVEVMQGADGVSVVVRFGTFAEFVSHVAEQMIELEGQMEFIKRVFEHGKPNSELSPAVREFIEGLKI